MKNKENKEVMTLNLKVPHKTVGTLKLLVMKLREDNPDEKYLGYAFAIEWLIGEFQKFYDEKTGRSSK